MVSSYLEISTGSKNRMYTLWKHSFVKGITPTQKFIKNLSIFYEQALEGIKGIAEKLQLELIEGESGLNKIIRKDSGLVYFGKYRGKSVDQLEGGYLVWLADGGKIEAVEEGSYM